MEIVSGISIGLLVVIVGIYLISFLTPEADRYREWVREQIKDTRKSNGWMPAKRSLPRETGKYWVCYHGGGQGIEHYDAKQKAFGVWSTCFYFDKDDEDEYFEPIYCVVAWRKLPPDYCEKE